MDTDKLTSADWMRIQNTRSVLKVIHDGHGIYRKLIAAKTNLASQTVTNIIATLTDKNIVREESLRVPSKGRNPVSLKINYADFYIVSIQITVHTLKVILNTLEGIVLSECLIEVNKTMDVLSRFKSVLNLTVEKWKTQYKINGIVISLEGIVNERDAIAIESEGINWHHVKLRDELSYLNIPIFLHNDVNLVAHYENTQTQDNLNFMVIKLDNGVGSAIVIDKHVMYSTNRLAGELGHVAIDYSGTPVQCFCGRKNCITQFISKSALQLQLNKEYQAIQKDVSEQVEVALRVIENVADLLAPVLANLVTLLDLDRIIVMGCIAEDFKDILYPRLYQRIKENMSFWAKFDSLEFRKYDDFPKICSQFVIDYYFSESADFLFLWDIV